MCPSKSWENQRKSQSSRDRKGFGVPTRKNLWGQTWTQHVSRDMNTAWHLIWWYTSCHVYRRLFHLKKKKVPICFVLKYLQVFYVFKWTLCSCIVCRLYFIIVNYWLQKMTWIYLPALLLIRCYLKSSQVILKQSFAVMILLLSVTRKLDTGSYVMHIFQ